MSDELQGMPRLNEAHPLPSEAHHLPSEALANRHPGLDPGTRLKASSHGNVAAYDWFPDQVRDDDYREPRLEEDVCCCCRQNVMKTKFKTNGIEQALIIHPNC